MVNMTAQVRKERGSRQSRRIRNEGLVPAIVYGHRQDPVAISLSAHDVSVALLHGERLVELDVDGDKQNALFKDVQWDTFGQDILHVDFARVDLNERVEITVPIELRGTPVGVTEEDGVLQQIAAEVEIECIVTGIPDEIRISVTDLHINDMLTMADLELPSGAKLISEPDEPVCSVSFVTEEEVAPEEEGAEALEPELIGEQPEGEDEGEEGEGEAPARREREEE